jgi:MSHA pilin protein MshA
MVQNIRRNQGFTLIELVAVIVLLGILSVTALPRFIGLSSDARAAVVTNILSQMKATANMLHMKAIVTGNLNGIAVINIPPTGDYEFFNGYPETRSEATNPRHYFLEFLELSGEETIDISNNSQRRITYGDLRIYENNDVSRVGYGSGTLSVDACYAQYRLTADDGHSFFIDTSGC